MDQPSEDTPLFAPGSLGRPPLYVYIVVACASLNTLSEGFHLGVASGVSVLVQQQWDLSDWQAGSYVGCLAFLAALGAGLTSGLADLVGRCKAFAMTQVVFIVGSLVSCLAPGYNLLMIGRGILAIGFGMGSSLDMLYIAELAPANHRGALCTACAFGLNGGVLLGFVVNVACIYLMQEESWRLMLAIGVLPPLILLPCLLFFMPESPRWLVMSGQDDKAVEILRRTHRAGVAVEPILHDVKHGVACEQASEEKSWGGVYLDLAKSSSKRKQLLLGIALAVTQQATGIDSVISYAPRILGQAGLSSRAHQFSVTVLIGLVKLTFVSVVAMRLDESGRRPLLISSMVGMALCHAMLAIGLTGPFNVLAVAALFLMVAAFCLGAGPITSLVALEVMPLRLRATGMSMAVAANRVTSGLISTTFLPMAGAVGYGGYFALLSIVALLIAVAVYFVVPETKQLTLEQVSDRLSSRGEGQAVSQRMLRA